MLCSADDYLHRRNVFPSSNVMHDAVVHEDEPEKGAYTMVAPPQPVTISTTLTQVSCGSTTNVWGVDAAGNIYQYQSSDGGKTWTQTQISGTLKQVSVGADGTVWGVQSNGNIFQYVGGGDWHQISGVLAQIAVGSASYIWGVQSNGNIFQYVGGGDWHQISGALLQVSVASDGTVWGVQSNGNIFQYVGGGDWTQMPGHPQQGTTGNNGTFTFVDVASASMVYALDTSDPTWTLYRYQGNSQTPPWQPQGSGAITYVSVASDGTLGVIDNGVTTVRY